MTQRSEHFLALEAALKAAGIHQPVLLIDLDRLDQNIETMLALLPEGMAYRIVAKSLPIPQLLAHIRTAARTDKLMTFNLPMLLDLSAAMPDADQLLGKPLPAAAFRQFQDSTSRDRSHRVTWLVDTAERLSAYAEIARSLDRPAAVALELDVGLHRGGFDSDDQLKAALNQVRQDQQLSFAGFVGYEPHLASVPKALGWRRRETARSWQTYREALALARAIFGGAHTDSMIRNTAGSPTFRLYRDTTLANEVAVGSALVKPTHFDTELLEPFLPACYLATPVLKVAGATRLPGFGSANGVLRRLRPSTAQTFFIHGGNWLATPVDPPGLVYNSVFGRSSNQEMLNGPKTVALAPEDVVFLRPHQSEALFLQFGDVAIVRNGTVIDRWKTLPIST